MLKIAQILIIIKIVVKNKANGKSSVTTVIKKYGKLHNPWNRIMKWKVMCVLPSSILFERM